MTNADTGAVDNTDATAVVAKRLAGVRRRIDATDRVFDHPVDVLPVTKGFGPWAVAASHAAGCRTIGENYAQDLLTKRDIVEQLGMGVHFIGQLQSKKIRQLTTLVSMWESIDRPSLLRELAQRAPGASLLVQVNMWGGDGKGGCAPGDIDTLVGEARGLGLDCRGLMAVGPTGASPEDAREGFAQVRRKVDELGLTVCSMGMTADLEVAVSEGATQVRVGSALFGERPARQPAH